MNFFSVFKFQRDFIRGVIEKRLVIPAIIIGIFGVYSFPITSFLARIALKKELNNEIFLMLVEFPLKSILYFSLSVGIIYIVALLFKAETKIVEYTIASGFGGIYSFLISITLAPIPSLSRFVTQNGQPNQLVLMLTFVLVITGIISAFFALKYSIISISEVFKFKILTSVFIWICTFVPLIILTNNMWKVS